MLRFLIADDQPVVRQDLKETLAGAFGDAVIGEAHNAHEARQAVRHERWSAIVLDTAMLGKGLDVLGMIKRRRLKTPVLLLSPESGSQDAIRALKRGAAGCLTKQSAVRELASAVREALSGNRYVSPAVLVSAVRGAPEARAVQCVMA